MIKFTDILATQLSIRQGQQVPGMADFVRAGGRFTKGALANYAARHEERPSPLVQLNRFEDGLICLLDGHHRGIGIFEGGRDYFADDEYQIKSYTYQDFLDIVFLRPNGEWMGWVTPFDPRKSVRLSDTKSFKERVHKLYYEQSPDHARHLILTMPHLYKCDRDDLPAPVDTIEQLRDTWSMESYTLIDEAGGLMRLAADN